MSFYTHMNTLLDIDTHALTHTSYRQAKLNRNQAGTNRQRETKLHCV